MVFSSDYSCIWHAVYHNRKVSINFREMDSEVTAVYFIDQMQSPNTLSSCLPSTSQLYRFSLTISSVKLNYSKSDSLNEIRFIDIQRIKWYHNSIFLKPVIYYHRSLSTWQDSDLNYWQFYIWPLPLFKNWYPSLTYQSTIDYYWKNESGKVCVQHEQHCNWLFWKTNINDLTPRYQTIKVQPSGAKLTLEKFHQNCDLEL